MGKTHEDVRLFLFDHAPYDLVLAADAVVTERDALREELDDMTAERDTYSDLHTLAQGWNHQHHDEIFATRRLVGRLLGLLRAGAGEDSPEYRKAHEDARAVAETHNIPAHMPVLPQSPPANPAAIQAAMAHGED